MQTINTKLNLTINHIIDPFISEYFISIEYLFQIYKYVVMLPTKGRKEFNYMIIENCKLAGLLRLGTFIYFPFKL